ncbi:hypothetical protein ACHQM5_009472 [Ranunculus cassubicifolius]
MSTKRTSNENGEDIDELEAKRIRTTRPTFSAVLKEAVMMKHLQGFCSSLEPMLRRVVNEEVEKGFARGIQAIPRTPSLQILAQEPSNFELCFTNNISLPVFTGSKIEDEYKQPLQLIIIDSRGNQRVRTALPCPIKIKIVVLNGDFATGDGENWTSEYFKSKIVQERKGKRPLITGEVVVTMRDGCVSVGELTFTDNSSWIRTGTFRIGAQVDEATICNGTRIREAITHPFKVKDHRGELYKKHHPPALEDEVWRLEKIGKDGKFHTKLSAEGITTVQDFLKLWVVDPARLREILGAGMSDKVFEITIKHAKDCVLGNKNYLLRGPRYDLFLNPICQVVGFSYAGMRYPSSDLHGTEKANVENLVRDAYTQWSLLEEVEGFVNENALLTLGSIQ